MNPLIVVLCITNVAVIVVFVLMLIRKRANTETQHGDLSLVSVSGDYTNDLLTEDVSEEPSHELSVSFESLPALTESESSSLVEIKDKGLISAIDNAIPNTLQALTNSAVAKSGSTLASQSETLYQVIIPKGAKLDPSRTMKGAFRATARYPDAKNRYGVNANLMKYDTSTGKTLSTVGNVNAAMNVASLVVGQYYMSQISEQLKGLSTQIEAIESFQQNEFKSKVYALVAEVQSMSIFQMEIMNNDELRMRTLDHLQNLKHECAQLLGQANLTIQSYTQKTYKTPDEYEAQIERIDIWYSYTQILLSIIRKLSALDYVLNKGFVSREYSYTLSLPYEEQTEKTLAKLREWHNEHEGRLKIDVDQKRRTRTFKNDKLRRLFSEYKMLPDKMVEQISKQSAVIEDTTQETETDLYQEDSRLIARDGKLYYLPKAGEENSNA